MMVAPRRKGRYVQETGTEVRLRELLRLIEAPGSTFTVKELAELSGLRHQQASVALTTLQILRRAVRVYDPVRRQQVWRSGSSPAGKRKGGTPAAATFYSVPEASEITGHSEKALWSRIQRKTLPVVHEGKRVLVSRSALQVAGLIDGRWRRTQTAERIEAMVDVLRLERGAALSTWQLEQASRLPRQSCELALATLLVAGRVERRPAGGVVWAWRAAR
jgi:hypothetical protein